MKLNYSDLSKQSKIGYNALYNVIFAQAHFDEDEKKFTVPLCLDANNKVSLTERNFIYFDSILKELKIYGYYTIAKHCGRAVEDSKTDFSTVEILLSKKPVSIPADIKNFSFTDIDLNKLLKRNGKAEKAKTAENAKAKAEETAKVEETAKALEEKTAKAEETSRKLEEKNAEVEKLKKEVAKKDEQLNKKAIAEFNDDALFTIADCVEVLIKKHCPVPAEFDFSAFENDLFQVINSHWDLKVLDK